MEHEVEGGRGSHFSPKHEPSPFMAEQIQKDDPLPLRRDLLKERNDISTTVAQSIAKRKQDAYPTYFESGKLNQIPAPALSSPFTKPRTQTFTLLSSQAASSFLNILPPKTNRKRGVPHIYRDFSNVLDTAGYVRKKTGGVTQPFPEKLHEMLDRANDPSVVTWLAHGRAFLVKKSKEFTDHVMPRYFRQTKLTSFQRQLNLYGFRRITQGPDAGAYYHELFLRGRPQLCMRMQRQKVKGTGHKQPADAQTEPNFYTMPPSQAQNPEPSQHAQVAPTSSSQSQPSPQPEMSPGLRGVHGAAHLLKTIAAGLPGSSMKTPFSLGGQVTPPASGSAFSTSSDQLVCHPQSIPPKDDVIRPSTIDQSLSLLGRVSHTDHPLPTSPTSSFIWPPIRPPRVAVDATKVTSTSQPEDMKKAKAKNIKKGNETKDLSTSKPPLRKVNKFYKDSSEIGEPSALREGERKLGTQTQLVKVAGQVLKNDLRSERT